jgi:hypothetical protein
VTGCKEQLESRYPTVNAAAQAGAFKRGWLPGVLQPDAADMRSKLPNSYLSFFTARRTDFRLFALLRRGFRLDWIW